MLEVRKIGREFMKRKRRKESSLRGGGKELGSQGCFYSRVRKNMYERVREREREDKEKRNAAVMIFFFFLI